MSNNKYKGMMKYHFLHAVILVLLAIIVFTFQRLVPNFTITMLGIMILLIGGVFLLMSINDMLPGNKAKVKGYIFSIAIMILGIVVLINPEATLRYSILILGIILVLRGLSYIVNKKEEVNNRDNFIISNIIAGTITIILSAKAYVMLSTIIGLIITIFAINEIYLFTIYAKLQKEYKKNQKNNK